MTTQSAFPADQQANLAAYLDGELDETAATQIEQTLALNPAARRELDALAESWELLDVLPKALATQEFTRQTLATIQLQSRGMRAASESGVGAARVKRLAVMFAVWAVAACFVALTTFAVTSRWAERRYAPILRLLPLLEHDAVYSEVQSLEFLQKLHASGLLADYGVFGSGDSGGGRLPVSGGGGQSGSVLLESPPVMPPIPEIPVSLSPAEAAARIEQMSSAQREALQEAFRRFQRLPEAARLEREALHRAVAEDAELRKTLFRFHVWLGELEPVLQQRVRLVTGTEARLAEIREIRRQQRLAVLTLSDEDVRAILELAERKAPINSEFARRYLSGAPNTATRQIRWLEMLVRSIQMKASGGIPKPDAVDEVIGAISDAHAREILQAEPSPEARWVAVVGAMVNTLRKRFEEQAKAFAPDPQKLQETLQNLPVDERSRILQMSPELAQRELRRAYFMQQADHVPPGVADAYRSLMRLVGMLEWLRMQHGSLGRDRHGDDRGQHGPPGFEPRNGGDRPRPGPPFSPRGFPGRDRKEQSGFPTLPGHRGPQNSGADGRADDGRRRGGRRADDPGKFGPDGQVLPGLRGGEGEDDRNSAAVESGDVPTGS